MPEKEDEMLPEPPENSRRVKIDAVAAYFQRRMQAAENEALLLADQVRTLTDQNSRMMRALEEIDAQSKQENPDGESS